LYGCALSGLHSLRSFGKVTGCKTAIRKVSQRRLFDLSTVDRNGASGMKPAAGRRIDGRRNVAFEHNPLFLCGGIWNRNRAQQRLRVWVLWCETDLLARPHFDE